MKKLLTALVAVGFVIGCGGDTSTKPSTGTKPGTTTTPPKKDEPKKDEPKKDEPKK